VSDEDRDRVGDEDRNPVSDEDRNPVGDEDRGPVEDREPEAVPDRGKGEKADEVVPGADLEPDLVLDERPEEDRYDEPGVGGYTEEEPGEQAEAEPAAPTREPEPVAVAPVELAADARYQATGKRKSAVARVILRPGSGEYRVNGRSLEHVFPRAPLQKAARDPLQTTGNDKRMDVVARIHGGGVASQAGALRHGIARALVEADPNLRGELKRRGFLTRDPRVKERKKAGLKKARKRPQFSKR
jgi:small subunit ribosomal protein S9